MDLEIPLFFEGEFVGVFLDDHINQLPHNKEDVTRLPFCLVKDDKRKWK